MSWQYNPGFVQYVNTQTEDLYKPPVITVQCPVDDHTGILGDGSLRSHGYLMSPRCINVWKECMTMMFDVDAECNEELMLATLIEISKKIVKSSSLDVETPVKIRICCTKPVLDGIVL